MGYILRRIENNNGIGMWKGLSKH